MIDKKIIVVIPSYEPPSTFESYVNSLIDNGVHKVIVVNDGSCDKYNKTYEKIENINGVTLLSYSDNRGKGYALKFAFSYIKENFDGDYIIVTADCDGQHDVSDVLNVALEVSSSNLLVLGSRDFNLESVPKRSSFGNVSTRRLFKLLYGLNLKDTQTGLRAFSSSLLDFMLNISGTRFEYEMNVLIVCHKNDVTIKEIPVKTIYESKPSDVEKRSHFKTFSDSLRVWTVLFRNVNTYVLAVVLSLIIEICFFIIGEYSLYKNLYPALRTLLSSVTARVISSAFNYFANYKFVFNGKGKSTVFKYYALWAGLLASSYLLTNFFGNVLGLPVVLFKVIVDGALSIMSYRIQTTWVFKRKKNSA